MKNSFYEILITSTGKPIGNTKENYTAFNNIRELFKTIEEVENFLKENYQGHKKEKMYIYKKDGQSLHIGYIYSFKNGDVSHYPMEQWYQKDWVEIRKIQAEPVILSV